MDELLYPSLEYEQLFAVMEENGIDQLVDKLQGPQFLNIVVDPEQIDYDRFLPTAYPYYLGAASMVMGFTLFTTVFLFGSASSAIVVVATHFLVFFNTFKNLVPLI